MASILIGLAVAIISFLGVLRWRAELVIVLKGFLPISVCIVGILAIVIGVSAMIPRDNEKLELKKK